MKQQIIVGTLPPSTMPCIVPAIVRGQWALHRAPTGDMWAVSYVPTGECLWNWNCLAARRASLATVRRLFRYVLAHCPDRAAALAHKSSLRALLLGNTLQQGSLFDQAA